MYSELDCGVCYRTYDAARRCPRELRCKHSFCESCLAALERPLLPAEAEAEARPGAGSRIACPLCRHPTFLSGGGSVRAELRVDEAAMERLLAAGVLDQEEHPEEEEEEDAPAPGGDDEEAEAPQTQTEESDSSADRRGGRLGRTWRKVWRKVRGKISEDRQADCMTNDELKGLAMMAWCIV